MKQDTKPKTTQNCPLTILTPQKENSDDRLTFKGGSWLQYFQVTLTPSTLNAVLVLYHCCNKLTQTWECKQNICIILHFWGQKSNIGLTGLKSRCQQDCLLEPSGGSRGQSVSWPFPASRSRPYSLTCGPLLHLQSQRRW